MTTPSPLARPAVENDPNRCFSDRQRKEIFLRDGGKCAICKRILKWGERWTAGHIIDWAIGGPTEVSNGQIECHKNGCHIITQKLSAKRAAKSKRQGLITGQQARRKRKGPSPKSGKRKLQGPGFSKEYTRGFDGKVRKK